MANSHTLQEQQARNASYFIAASFWNNEDILDSWTTQALKLIDILGRPNVYVSLTENDSDDNTASKLLHFGRELTRRNIAHSVNITTDLRGYPRKIRGTALSTEWATWPIFVMARWSPWSD